MTNFLSEKVLVTKCHRVLGILLSAGAIRCVSFITPRQNCYFLMNAGGRRARSTIVSYSGVTREGTGGRMIPAAGGVNLYLRVTHKQKKNYFTF